MTGSYSRFGRSVEEGEDQPGCEMMPQAGSKLAPVS